MSKTFKIKSLPKAWKGGGTIMDLTPEEIKLYQDAGYVIDDIPLAQNGQTTSNPMSYFDTQSPYTLTSGDVLDLTKLKLQEDTVIPYYNERTGEFRTQEGTFKPDQYEKVEVSPGVFVARFKSQYGDDRYKEFSLDNDFNKQYYKHYTKGKEYWPIYSTVPYNTKLQEWKAEDAQEVPTQRTGGYVSKQITHFQDGGNKRYPWMQGLYGPRVTNETSPEITRENLNNIYPVFRNLGDVELTADPNFTSSTSGLGSIEYISPERGDEPIRYPSGYELVAPKPGVHNIVYDPNSNNINNVALDLFSHGLRDVDPTYQKYLKEFTDVYKKSPRANSMNRWYEIDAATGNAPDGREQYEDNWIDGDLRGIFHRGTDAEKMDEHYYTKQYEETTEGSPELVNKIQQIKKYIETPHLDYLEKSLQLPKNQNGGNTDPGNNALELHMFYDKNNFQKGGQLYTFQGADYMKENGKWFKSVNGQFTPLTKGDVAKRSKVLDAQAHKLSPYELQERERKKEGLPLYDPLITLTPQVASTTKVESPVGNKAMPKKAEEKIAQNDALARYLTQSGKAELFLGDKYWNQDGSRSMQQMIREAIQKDPNIMKKIDKLEFERFLDEEKKAYENATPLQKGLNAATAFIADPVLTTQNAIFGSEETGLHRPLANQYRGLNDPNNPNSQFYKQATGYDDNWLNWGVNMVNPGQWAAQAHLANERGDYVDAYGNLILNVAGGTGLTELAEQSVKKLPQLGEEISKKIPTYESVYRLEPTSFQKTSDLSGRWFTNDVDELPFYLRHLKDPESGVRIMKKKMPTKEWEKLSGVNMSERARSMSAGTGKYATYQDAANAGELSIGAANRLSKDVPIPSDLQELFANKNLINLTEGILPEELVTKYRTGTPNKLVSSWQRVEFPEGDLGKKGAWEYIFNIDKQANESLLGIPSKYLPVDSDAIKGLPKNIADQFRSLLQSKVDVGDVHTSGLDGNFMTRPLTMFTKNELTPGNNLWYRKIGNEKGLLDLINKQGAQAPAPMRMRSGLTLDAPFFGVGSKPNENYKGLYAVELKPEARSKYNMRSYVGGVENYGSVPFLNDELVRNVPLEDLNVYRKKWFSNNYKKLDPENLSEGLKNAALQRNLENAYKWGIRGIAADQLFNDGRYTGQIINLVNPEQEKRNNSYQNNQKVNFDDGGSIQYLSQKEIDDLRRRGYIVEEDE